MLVVALESRRFEENSIIINNLRKISRYIICMYIFNKKYKNRSTENNVIIEYRKAI